MTTNYSPIYPVTVSKSLLRVLGTLPCQASQTPNCSKRTGLLVKAKEFLTSTRRSLALILSVPKKWLSSHLQIVTTTSLAYTSDKQSLAEAG